LEQWLTVKTAGRGLSPHTVRAYRADVATFAAHLQGVSPADRGVADRVALSELTPGGVTVALSAVQAGGAADKTRARLHGTLTGLFAYLIQQGLLDQDPLLVAGVDRPKVGKRLPRYVDKPAEFARVIAAAATPDSGARDPWPQRDLALAGLLAGTAARAGEVCALTVGDLVLGGEEPYARVVGKGSVTRDCPLSPELVGVLQAYLTTRQARTGASARKKDVVFLNTRLAPLSTAALDHCVRRWFARADVPLPRGAAAHAFRHTVAMQLIGLGESATIVQDLLGHASLSSTQVYTKAAGRHVRAAANALPVRHLMQQLPDR
jgi:site-specific recombinase XerD